MKGHLGREHPHTLCEGYRQLGEHPREAVTSPPTLEGRPRGAAPSARGRPGPARAAMAPPSRLPPPRTRTRAGPPSAAGAAEPSRAPRPPLTCREEADRGGRGSAAPGPGCRLRRAPLRRCPPRWCRGGRRFLPCPRGAGGMRRRAPAGRRGGSAPGPGHKGGGGRWPREPARSSGGRREPGNDRNGRAGGGRGSAASCGSPAVRAGLHSAERENCGAKSEAVPGSCVRAVR